MEARIMRDRDDGMDANIINEPGVLWLRGDNVALEYWNEKAICRWMGSFRR